MRRPATRRRLKGWTPVIIDTNGNGKRDDFVQPNQPVDPTKDKRINAAFYGIGVNPADGTVWGSVLGFPGSIMRLDPGSDPSKTALGGNLRSCRRRATGRAASTSTATASPMCRWRAATWASSTAASAKARSTARRPPRASCVRKAGR